MGPTWIIVTVRKNGGLEVDDYDNEEEALADYEKIRNGGGYTDVWLTVVRAEAHTL